MLYYPKIRHVFLFESQLPPTYLKAGSRVGCPNNFLNVSKLFLLKKENYLIFPFAQSLFSTKKSPRVVNLPLSKKRSV